VRLDLRFLLDYVVAKNESDFSRPGLTFEVAALTERKTRRDVAYMNIGKVSSKEEAAIFIASSGTCDSPGSHHLWSMRPARPADKIIIFMHVIEKALIFAAAG
jgi:hypothetical protein